MLQTYVYRNIFVNIKRCMYGIIYNLVVLRFNMSTFYVPYPDVSVLKKKHMLKDLQDQLRYHRTSHNLPIRHIRNDIAPSLTPNIFSVPLATLQFQTLLKNNILFIE